MHHEFTVGPTKQQYIGVGSLCQFLQILPAQLQTLMEAAGIAQFDLSLDGVCYLTGAHAERVAEKCREVRQEISDATTKAERFAAN
jgi:hypothetical protein